MSESLPEAALPVDGALPENAAPESAAVPPASGVPVLAAARAMRFFMIVALLTVIADQASKVWIRSLIPLGVEHEIVPGLLSFSHILNRGAAWGMLSGQRFFLIGITFVVMFIVAQMAREFAPQSAPARFGLGLILGGAVGNLIDRIVTGAVTDFIDLGTSVEFIRTFPIFNIADSALTVGVILLILDVVLNRRLKVE